MQQIQLPQGMKDTILNECEKKKYLQNTLEQIFESFGYEEIITPTIEYYETYENAFKNIQTTDMYKFFDENGRILTLRTVKEKADYVTDKIDNDGLYKAFKYLKLF